MVSKVAKHFQSLEFEEKASTFLRAQILCEHYSVARIVVIIDDAINCKDKINGKDNINGNNAFNKFEMPVVLLKLIASYISDLPKFLYAEIKTDYFTNGYWILPMVFDGEKILTRMIENDKDSKDDKNNDENYDQEVNYLKMFENREMELCRLPTSRNVIFTPFTRSAGKVQRSKVEIDEALAEKLIEAWYRYTIFGYATFTLDFDFPPDDNFRAVKWEGDCLRSYDTPEKYGNLPPWSEKPWCSDDYGGNRFMAVIGMDLD